MAGPVESAPKRFAFSSERPDVTYELIEDLIAAHGGEMAEGAIKVLEGGQVAVHRADMDQGPSRKGSGVGPVYRQVPGNRMAVPTGRILVRFADGDKAAEHRERLAAAGYKLEQVLPYAPHACWVRAASKRITDSLKQLDSLQKLPGVVNVEPQMISEARSRGA